MDADSIHLAHEGSFYPGGLITVLTQFEFVQPLFQQTSDCWRQMVYRLSDTNVSFKQQSSASLLSDSSHSWSLEQYCRRDVRLLKAQSYCDNNTMGDVAPKRSRVTSKSIIHHTSMRVLICACIYLVYTSSMRVREKLGGL